MKKIVLMLVLIGLFACGEDSPTEPTNEYPIIHKYLAQELAFKVNMIRRERGLKEFKYLTEIEYTKNGKTLDFDTETSIYPDNNFEYNQAFVITHKYDDLTIIMKKDFYLKTDVNITESIAEVEWLWWYGELPADETLISINIVEKENTYPKRDKEGNINGQYGLHKFDVYLYIKRINPPL